MANIPEGSPERQTFVDGFTNALVDTLTSSGLEVASEDIVILSLTPGSVVVQYEIRGGDKKARNWIA